MSFVQELLKGQVTTTPSGISQLNLTGSKTVTLGNTIIVFTAGWVFGTGVAGDTMVDNLGNTYTRVFWDSATAPRPPEVELMVFTAPVTNPGLLTQMTFTHYINRAYHMSGCSAEFTEPISMAGYQQFFLGTTATGGIPHGAGTSLATSPITVASSLMLHFCGIGGGISTDVGEQGDATAYVPPAGFSLASGVAVGAANASSCMMSYKYGSLTSEVLTASWEASRRASVVTVAGAAWTPPPPPDPTSMYFRVSP